MGAEPNGRTCAGGAAAALQIGGVGDVDAVGAGTRPDAVGQGAGAADGGGRRSVGADVQPQEGAGVQQQPQQQQQQKGGDDADGADRAEPRRQKSGAGRRRRRHVDAGHRVAQVAQPPNGQRRRRRRRHHRQGGASGTRSGASDQGPVSGGGAGVHRRNGVADPRQSAAGAAAPTGGAATADTTTSTTTTTTTTTELGVVGAGHRHGRRSVGAVAADADGAGDAGALLVPRAARVQGAGARERDQETALLAPLLRGRLRHGRLLHPLRRSRLKRTALRKRPALRKLHHHHHPPYPSPPPPFPPVTTLSLVLPEVAVLDAGPWRRGQRRPFWPQLGRRPNFGASIRFHGHSKFTTTTTTTTTTKQLLGTDPAPLAFVSKRFFFKPQKKRNKIHFGNSFTTSFFCFFFCNRFQSRIHAVDWVWSNHGAIISGRFALGQWRTGTGVLRFRVVVVCYVRGPSCWIDDHSGIPSCPLVRSDGNETKISTKKKKETPAIAKKMAQTHTPPPPLVSVSLFVGCVVFENSPHVVFFFIDRQIGELFFY